MSAPLPTPVRTLLVASLMALAVLLLGGLAPAHAATHRHGSHATAANVADDGRSQMTQIVVSAAPSEHGSGHAGHHGANPACCEGTACLSMHAGLLATPLLPQPPGAASSARAGTDRLADGLGIAPALPPPRRSV